MRVVAAVASLTTVLGGAAGGCGKTAVTSHARPPAVSVQLRQALAEAIGSRSLGQPPLPFATVRGCRGPADGGAGIYRCTAVPREPHGVSVLVIRVRVGGSWRSAPIPVHGRHGWGSAGLWGAGLRVPS